MVRWETFSVSRRTPANLETYFCTNCLIILEHQLPETLRACTGNALPFKIQTWERICYVASEMASGTLAKYIWGEIGSLLRRINIISDSAGWYSWFIRLFENVGWEFYFKFSIGLLFLFFHSPWRWMSVWLMWSRDGFKLSKRADSHCTEGLGEP